MIIILVPKKEKKRKDEKSHRIDKLLLRLDLSYIIIHAIDATAFVKT